MRFHYTASQPDGKTVEGDVDVANQSEVIGFLSNRGLKPLSIREAKGWISMFGMPVFRGAISNTDKVFITKYLALMLRSGTDLFRALDILIEDFKQPATKAFLKEARLGLSKGQPFYSSFAKYPKTFDSIFVNLVKSGEASGNLDRVFQDLSVALEQQHELNVKVRSALVYPALLLGVSLIILTLLLTLALPRIAEVFSSSGFEPPFFSRVVFAVGIFLSKYLIFLIIFSLASFFSGIYLFHNFMPFRRFVSYLVGRLPVVNSFLVKLGLQRFAAILGSLIKAGLTINDSIEITADTAGNPELKVSLLRISRQGLAKGLTLSEAFRRETFFPRVVVNLISVSEKTGKIEEILATLADFYDREIDSSIKSMISLLEPLLLLFIGVIIGGIALAMIVPIYQLVTQF